MIGERPMKYDLLFKKGLKLWKQYFKQHAIKWVRASAPSRASMLQ